LFTRLSLIRRNLVTTEQTKMDIRNEAFGFCKALAGMPAKAEIAQAVLSLNNTQLGYIGHNNNAQAFGYLLAHQKRENLAHGPLELTIEPLDDEVLSLLAGFHNEIADLNAKCLKQLSDSCPRLNMDVLSPYNRFEKIDPISIDRKVEIFPETHTKQLVEAFGTHPLIQVAIETVPVVPIEFSTEHYVRQILNLEKGIKDCGPLEVLQQVREISDSEPMTSQRRVFFRHLGAILGLRASLSILNQLIYTKVFSDKLLILDEDNIIKFGIYNFGTGGANVVFINAGLMFMVEVNDIIILKTVLLGELVTKFCRVESLDPGIAFDFGNPRYIELREIDENLNPYGLLFADV
jgi:hypothetical protein